MDDNNIKKYREKLIEEKKRILETVEEMREHGLSKSQREEVTELSMIDNHPADMGTEMFDKERRYALIDNEEDILSHIDEALDRIKNGKYGRCELCGKDISRERLDFLPYAVTCIECENKKPDYITYRYDRPVEEETLGAFGRYFKDSDADPEDEVGFNGEDSWQDADKYNKRPGIVRNFDDQDEENEPYSEAENDSGIVEFTDSISNQQYKDQLP